MNYLKSNCLPSLRSLSLPCSFKMGCLRLNNCVYLGFWTEYQTKTRSKVIEYLSFLLLFTEACKGHWVISSSLPHSSRTNYFVRLFQPVVCKVVQQIKKTSLALFCSVKKNKRNIARIVRNTCKGEQYIIHFYKKPRGELWHVKRRAI